MCFNTGRYQLENDIVTGCIVNQSTNVVINDGYYLAKAGRIAGDIGTITINGGFFIYDVEKGIRQTGEVILPAEQALIKTQITMGDVVWIGAW